MFAEFLSGNVKVRLLPWNPVRVVTVGSWMRSPSTSVLRAGQRLALALGEVCSDLWST